MARPFERTSLHRSVISCWRVFWCVCVCVCVFSAHGSGLYHTTDVWAEHLPRCPSRIVSLALTGIGCACLHSCRKFTHNFHEQTEISELYAQQAKCKRCGVKGADHPYCVRLHPSTALPFPLSPRPCAIFRICSFLLSSRALSFSLTNTHVRTYARTRTRTRTRTHVHARDLCARGGVAHTLQGHLARDCRSDPKYGLIEDPEDDDPNAGKSAADIAWENTLKEQEKAAKVLRMPQTLGTE